MADSVENIFTPSDRMHLPQVVSQIFPVNGLAYVGSQNSNPVVEFIIPATTGFISAPDTILSYDFTYTGDVANIRPQANGGLGLMCDQIDIYSVNSGQLLEQLLDVDLLTAVQYSFDMGADREIQSGKFNTRALTELAVRGNQNPQPFVDPASLPVAPIVPYQTPAYQTQTINLPISLSALLGMGGTDNGGITAVSAMGGLRVRFRMREVANFSVINTDYAQEYIDVAPWFFYSDVTTSDAAAVQIKITKGYNDVVDSSFASVNDYVTIPEGTYSVNTLNTALETAFGGSGVMTFGSASYNVGTSGGEGAYWEVTLGNVAYSADPFKFNGNFWENTGTGGPAAGVAVGATGTFKLEANNNVLGSVPQYLPLKWKEPYNCNPADLNTQPFLKGTYLQVKDDAGNYLKIKDTSTDYFVSQFQIGNLGSQTTRNVDTSFNYTQDKEIRIKFNDPTWHSKLTGASTIGSTSDTNNNKVQTILPTNIGYTMNNVTLKVTIVSPPPQYIKAMTSAIMSPTGLPIPISTWETLKTTQTQGETISNMLLSFVNTKGKSVLSVPNKAGVRSLGEITHSNFLRKVLPTNYYYQYENVKHPQLGVDCEKITAGIQATPYKPTLSRELIEEQIKAFEYCIGKVGSLDGYANGFQEKTFFFGKNLGVLGTTYNVRDSNLQLFVEATSAGGGLQDTLTYTHFLYAENVLSCKADGVAVFK